MSTRRSQPRPISHDLGDEVMGTSVAVVNLLVGAPHMSATPTKGQERSLLFAVKAMDPEMRLLRFIPALPYTGLWDFG